MRTEWNWQCKHFQESERPSQTDKPKAFLSVSSTCYIWCALENYIENNMCHCANSEVTFVGLKYRGCVHLIVRVANPLWLYLLASHPTLKRMDIMTITCCSQLLMGWTVIHTMECGRACWAQEWNPKYLKAGSFTASKSRDRYTVRGHLSPPLVTYSLVTSLLSNNNLQHENAPLESFCRTQ